MNCFDDLEFPFAAHVEDGHCRTHTPLYYGIQYNQEGSLELKISNDPKLTGNKVYLYLHYPNDEGFITVPDCSEQFKSARMLGSGTPLPLEYKPGKLLIHGTPEFELNTIPVICLER